MSSISVQVTVGVGSWIYSVAEDLVRMSKLLGMTIETKFNDLTIYATPEDTKESVVCRYDREAKYTRRIHNV